MTWVAQGGEGMKCGSQIAVAVVGGYFLGRSRKTRLAALLALLAAGGKIPIDQRELLRKTPLGAPLEKLTGDLKGQIVDAGMNVAKRAASNRIDSFSDKLQQRADTLRTPRPGGAAEEEDEEEQRPQRKGRREPPARRAREAPARAGRSRREPEPEEAPDEYDDYDDDDAYYDDQDDYDDRDDYDYEDEEDEDEPEERPSRPAPRRRAPRRDDERPRRGRAAR